MQVFIGSTDITKYIAVGGLKGTRNDLDGPNAGRALDGTMYRDRVAIKERIDITCRPLTTAEKTTILNLISPEYFTFRMIDSSGTTSFTAYTNNVPAEYLMKKGNVEYGTGITFPVIQR